MFVFFVRGYLEDLLMIVVLVENVLKIRNDDVRM